MPTDEADGACWREDYARLLAGLAQPIEIPIEPIELPDLDMREAEARLAHEWQTDYADLLEYMGLEPAARKGQEAG